MRKPFQNSYTKEYQRTAISASDKLCWRDLILINCNTMDKSIQGFITPFENSMKNDDVKLLWGLLLLYSERLKSFFKIFKTNILKQTCWTGSVILCNFAKSVIPLSTTTFFKIYIKAKNPPDKNILFTCFKMVMKVTRLLLFFCYPE